MIDNRFFLETWNHARYDDVMGDFGPVLQNFDIQRGNFNLMTIKLDSVDDAMILDHQIGKFVENKTDMPYYGLLIKNGIIEILNHSLK